MKRQELVRVRIIERIEFVNSIQPIENDTQKEHTIEDNHSHAEFDVTSQQSVAIYRRCCRGDASMISNNGDKRSERNDKHKKKRNNRAVKDIYDVQDALKLSTVRLELLETIAPG